MSESKRRWQVLVARQQEGARLLQSMDRCKNNDSHQEKSTHRKTGKNDDSETLQQEEDPFDCQSMAIPPMDILVDNVLEDFADQWEQLDYRRVSASNTNSEDQSGAAARGPATEGSSTDPIDPPPAKRQRITNRRGRWNMNQLAIPRQFDYETRRSEPPPDTGGGDRIVSLTDPTQTLSYERALWELFRQVPTVEEIQDQIMAGAADSLPHYTHMYNNLIETFQEYKGLDAHALSRLRHSDRHEMPSLLWSQSHPSNNQPNNPQHPSSHNDASASSTAPTSTTISTIVLECWRRQPKRGSSKDDARVVLEFLGSQTLRDVHRTLVELAQDDLWTTRSNYKSSDNSTTNNDATNDEEEDSGYFFIEDTFYTIGSVDYVTPIQRWLAAGKTRGNNNNSHDDSSITARCTVLGIHTPIDKLKVVPMAETRLEDIPFRLAVRYHHCCHGDVECSIFVSDMNHYQVPPNNANNNPLSHLSYPLVHDIWTPTYPYTECEACQKFPVSVATSPHCAITQGHRALCHGCSQQLFFQDAATTTTRAKAPLNTTHKVTSDDEGHNDGDATATEEHEASMGVAATDPTSAAAMTTTTTTTTSTSKTRKEACRSVLPYTVWRNQVSLSTAIKIRDPAY